MGGNVNYIYKPRTNLKSIDRKLGSTTYLKESNTIVNLQDIVKNLQGLATFFECHFFLFSSIFYWAETKNNVVVSRYEACLRSSAGFYRFLGDLMDA